MIHQSDWICQNRFWQPVSLPCFKTRFGLFWDFSWNWPPRTLHCPVGIPYISASVKSCYTTNTTPGIHEYALYLAETSPIIILSDTVDRGWGVGFDVSMFWNMPGDKCAHNLARHQNITTTAIPGEIATHSHNYRICLYTHTAGTAWRLLSLEIRLSRSCTIGVSSFSDSRVLLLTSGKELRRRSGSGSEERRGVASALGSCSL